MNQKFKVHLALFTVALIFSSNYVLAKIIMPTYIKPFGLILIRVWTAALLFWFLHSTFIQEKVKNNKDYWSFAYCAFFGVVANQLLFFKGLSLTQPINAAIIMTTTPILVLLVSAVLIKEKITFIKMLGVILGTTGALLLIGGKNLSFKTDTALGDLMLLGNACAYGIYLVLTKPLMKEYNAFTVVKWVFLFGCIGVFPFGFYEFLLIDWQNLPLFAYWILAFIVIGATFFAYLLNTWGLRYVNASMVGFYIYLQPVLTSLIAVSLGKDELTFQKVILCLLIFAGVYLVSLRQ